MISLIFVKVYSSHHAEIIREQTSWQVNAIIWETDNSGDSD